MDGEMAGSQRGWRISRKHAAGQLARCLQRATTYAAALAPLATAARAPLRKP